MGRRIDSKGVHFGRNRDLGTYNDDRYLHCSNCHFICHLDRNRPGDEDSRQGWGISQPSSTLSASVAVTDTTISVASTTGFSSSGYIYIYDAESDYSNGTNVDRVAYTGKTGTTFTGCSYITRTHAEDDIVRGEQVASSSNGCPFCGAMLYNKPVVI